MKIYSTYRYLMVVMTLFAALFVKAQQLPVMETGGQAMPDAWIDKDTGHKVFKLIPRQGANSSFYFHNNPFVGDEMIFNGFDQRSKGNDMEARREPGRSQVYAVNLKTQAYRQITNEPYPVKTEIVCKHTREIFFQHADSVFAMNIDDCQKRLVGVLPEGRHGGIVTVNADGTLLAGTLNDPKENEILRNNPKKSDYFTLIYEAKLRRTIFTMDTRTGQFSEVFSDNAWLNHLQFSPTDPMLLMFCHEGPWHKVDRIWTIDVVKRGEPRLIHKRSVWREIAGHEWWGADGKHIYFDLQKPRGVTFYIGKTNVYTGKEEDYELQRHEWSVHFVTSWDEKILGGDGGSKTSVAHSPEGQWIYKFMFNGKKFKTERLVNMKNHNYRLEPNVHFSPDNKLLIFRANFEGYQNVYAVEL